MKKMLLFPALLSLFVLLPACGNNEPTPSNPPKEKEDYTSNVYYYVSSIGSPHIIVFDVNGTKEDIKATKDTNGYALSFKDNKIVYSMGGYSSYRGETYLDKEEQNYYLFGNSVVIESASGTDSYFAKNADSIFIDNNKIVVKYNEPNKWKTSLFVTESYARELEYGITRVS